jgi:hypothetical protein
MDAKQWYWRGLTHFKRRNIDETLTRVNLQWGKNERWYAREFGLALQGALRQKPNAMKLYVDCEYSRADIAVLDGDDECLAVYEVKALYNGYSSRLMSGIIDKAHRQLDESVARISSKKKIGLFFLVFRKRGKVDASDRAALRAEEVAIGREAKDFSEEAGALIRRRFESDHNVRVTALSGLEWLSYVGRQDDRERWYTQSWISWGYPR